jgi:hypothetical protein
MSAPIKLPKLPSTEGFYPAAGMNQVEPAGPPFVPEKRHCLLNRQKLAGPAADE